MNQETFNAIVADEVDGKTQANLVQITHNALPDKDVLVKVDYSTLNYKDALAVSGKGKICRRHPMVCGIDLAGSVVESRDDRWAAGDKVLVNGFGLSEKHWGGYSQYQRVSADWLVRIPNQFDTRSAMAIGTAGYTAMLCVQAIEDHGVVKDAGPVVVSGATGGVGSVAIMLLAKLGYEVVAVTGRKTHTPYLEKLGASHVLERSELDRDSKPLEKEHWVAGVDSVGGSTLATILSQTYYQGIVTACGLAGGFALPSTVMPFILRGVTLKGIDSVMASMSVREHAWERLADLISIEQLDEVATIQSMSRLPSLADDLLVGKLKGRIVIDVNT